ncbi:MAG: FecR domain-containing protein, partial [Planctomycetes bacterium]|nr:FecR domain-containing protein [Planctomycetota bacterium]
MPEDDLERLIAAHLDDALAPDEAARLHARLRMDGEARRLLIAAARQAATLPRLALEHDARAAVPPPAHPPEPEAAPVRPRAPWRWPAAAAVFIATVGIGMLIRTAPPPFDLRVDGLAQIAHHAADSSGGPWLHAGDRITTTTGPATLSWTHEGTRLELGPDSSLSVEVASGAKRVRLERGALQAEVAHQPADGGVTIVTPFGRVEVVGTRFAVQIQEHGSTVSVERGAVRLVAAAAGQPAVLLESGYA